MSGNVFTTWAISGKADDIKKKIHRIIEALRKTWVALAIRQASQQQVSKTLEKILYETFKDPAITLKPQNCIHLFGKNNQQRNKQLNKTQKNKILSNTSSILP